MESTRVRNTSRNREFAELAEAFSDLTAHLNQPQLHARILEEAGVSLDAALARLLLGLRRHGGPIGLVEAAERAGRDHTTISRQVAKMAELGLVERRQSAEDRRVSTVAITAKGERIAEAISEAHMRIVLPALDGWNDRDFSELRRLMRRLADDVAQLREKVEPA